VKLYALIVALLMVPTVIALAIGVDPGIAITVSIVTTFLGAIVALLDLYRIYYSTPRPRSQFFRMLLDANSLKLLTFTWFAYVIVGTILTRYKLVDLPLPDPVARSFVSGIVTVAFLAATIYYAIRTRGIIKSMIPPEVSSEMPTDGTDGVPLPPDG